MKKLISLVLVIAITAGLLPFLPAHLAIAADNWPKAVVVAVSERRTAAICADGSLWVWGRNNTGQIGDGTTISKSVPVRVGTATDWASVSLGLNHTVAIKSDGSLWAWGSNKLGQLGDGTKTDRKTPTRIGSATDWVSIEASYDYTVAIKSDGSLWAWGNNSDCQLGDGTKTDRKTPTRIGTATNWVSVSQGSFSNTALKADGTLWFWGYQYSNQFGDADPECIATPMQIGTDTDWVSVAADFDHAAAIKTDGSLWTWGWNIYGALGDGTVRDSLEPVRVGTANDWKSVYTDGYRTAAIKTDGSLWVWGRNNTGQLGDGTNTSKNSPVQIGTTDEWACVATSVVHTIAVKKDGSLWAWGKNDAGQLGDGTNINKNTPVQIWGPPVSAASISLDRATVEIPTSYTVLLTATLNPTYATNKAVTWSSSDETIAMVDANGKVTGAALGTATITVTTEDGGFTASCDVTVVINTHSINYDGVEDMIVPGSADGFYIDLNKETITIPESYTPVIYSIDGGVKWRVVKDSLSTAKFSKLLDKDLTLQLSDKPINKMTKKPTEGASTVTFAKINKRPKLPTLVVNYAIGADMTGVTSGDWLLTVKNGTAAVKEGIQVGVADTNNKNTDEKGYGQFYDGLTNGISVKVLTGTKVEKTAYFIRTAPAKNDTTYIAASKPNKITVSGEQKAPKYKIKSYYVVDKAVGSVSETANTVIKVNKNTYVSIDGGEPKLYTAKTEVDVSNTTGAIELWIGTTAKNPASAKQTITR